MKKIVLLALLVLVSCSNNSANKMETDFEILTSQIRVKGSEDKEHVDWSQWKKDEWKFTWNSKSKELTFIDSDGYITFFKNCVVDGLKITVPIAGIKNPEVVVYDFSDKNIIRVHYDFDKLEDTNGDGIVNRVSLDSEFRVKK